ncbi:MAG: hypothetical protein JSU98_02305 [Gemmatimonadales bacterium]|nr:MAG: hypothetical protein JSU98_02305 [Gemmatimonadales bacterium]
MQPTQRSIFFFWLPLAATWLMMAAEGPFLAAVIARLADAKFNLAAYGVAYAFAILVEAPVIMLMSAATALGRDREAYRRLRNFMWGLNVIATGLLLGILIPAVHTLVMEGIVGLPEEVSRITYGALWLFLPWPAAIGYRRFLHGLLIRSGKTRLVAYGTVLRLVVMAVVAVALYQLAPWPGAWVGAASLSAGVVAEALAAHGMARQTVRSLRDKPESEPGPRGRITYTGIARFYYPLALTSLIGLAVQPMLTFFMGRAPLPLESLAVFPVVHALSFIFRSLGLSFQEAAIALLGDRHEHVDPVSRFAMVLGVGSSVALALVAFTPLADVWFVRLSGLDAELAAFAIWPTRILVPLPALSVWLSYQRAVLVQAHRTAPITVATSLEVLVIAVVFVLGGWVFGMVGVTAAFLAFLGGRTAANLFLVRRVARSLERSREDWA